MERECSPQLDLVAQASTVLPCRPGPFSSPSALHPNWHCCLISECNNSFKVLAFYKRRCSPRIVYKILKFWIKKDSTEGRQWQRQNFHSNAVFFFGDIWHTFQKILSTVPSLVLLQLFFVKQRWMFFSPDTSLNCRRVWRAATSTTESRWGRPSPCWWSWGGTWMR